MEKEKDPAPEYLKGFNTGYLLSKNEPELLSQILTTENNWSVYIDGIRAGQKEYLKEYALEKLQSKTDYQQPDYQKTFNLSYTIAKYDLKLSDQLSSISGNSTTLVSFRDGREQYLAEQTKPKMPNWLKNDPFSKEGKTPNQDKGKDIEPEL